MMHPLHTINPDGNSDVLDRGVFRKLSGVIQGLTVLIVLFSVIYYLLRPDTLPIRQIGIHGQFMHLSSDDLHSIVVDKVRGGFLNLNVDSIRNALIAEPWISDVSVKRIWPDKINVIIVEQTAMAKWRDDSLLNRAGQIFSPHPDTFPFDLPELNGPIGLEKTVLDKFIKMSDVLAPLDHRIVELLLSERRSWKLRLDNDLALVLGRTGVDERLTRFVELMPFGLMDRLAEVEYIDLRYPNGFSVKWNQGGGLNPSNGMANL